jgi:hypothetical protein
LARPTFVFMMIVSGRPGSRSNHMTDWFGAPSPVRTAKTGNRSFSISQARRSSVRTASTVRAGSVTVLLRLIGCGIPV